MIYLLVNIVIELYRVIYCELLGMVLLLYYSSVVLPKAICLVVFPAMCFAVWLAQLGWRSLFERGCFAAAPCRAQRAWSNVGAQYPAPTHSCKHNRNSKTQCSGHAITSLFSLELGGPTAAWPASYF